MHANIWNIRNSKQRLGILERTYAHKRHLQSILLAKSTINTNSSRQIRSPPYHKNCMQKNNPALYSSLTADRFSRVKQGFSLPKTPLDLSVTLNTYSNLNRLIKKREIEEENSKLFSRILTAAPTLKRKCWVRMQQQNEKYKENLCRKKFRQIDYSTEALKIIRNSPKFKLILASHRTTTVRS